AAVIWSPRVDTAYRDGAESGPVIQADVFSSLRERQPRRNRLVKQVVVGRRQIAYRRKDADIRYLLSASSPFVRQAPSSSLNKIVMFLWNPITQQVMLLCDERSNSHLVCHQPGRRSCRWGAASAGIPRTTPFGGA